MTDWRKETKKMFEEIHNRMEKQRQEEIAKAVAEAVERCAKIADSHDHQVDVDPREDIVCGGYNCGMIIATQIRESS